MLLIPQSLCNQHHDPAINRSGRISVCLLSVSVSESGRMHIHLLDYCHFSRSNWLAQCSRSLANSVKQRGREEIAHPSPQSSSIITKTHTHTNRAKKNTMRNELN